MFLTWAEISELLPALEEADRAMTMSAAEKSIRTFQTNLLFQLGMRDKGLMQTGFERYDKLTTSFKDELKGIAADFEKGSIDAETATKVWKEKTGAYYREIFQAGAMTSGNPFYNQLGLTKKDQAFLSVERRGESKYWNQFLSDIKDPNHDPRFDYQERAGFYADSAKSILWAGAIAGAGDQVEIWWVLGNPLTEHCDVCPDIAAGSPYTWETLPFMPGDGSTPCLFHCYCTLEILPTKKIGDLSDTPGDATPESINAQGRFAELTDADGNPVEGEAQRTVEDLYGQMYQARQYMEIASDPDEFAVWMARRTNINSQLIDFLEGRGYRATPTVSVSDLVASINSAAALPETTLMSSEMLAAGKEVLFIRANYVSFGVLAQERMGLSFVSGSGMRLPIKLETDIVYEMTGTRVTSSPTTNKTFFMQIFGKNKTTYDDFVKIYESAVASGSRIPNEVAWIRFRELYTNVLGKWVKR